MDNLTHTLTGWMLSRAGLNRWCPQASALLILSSNAPDVDVVSALNGSLRYLECHRHATHALPFAPLTALLPLLIVRLFTRKPFSWARAYALSLCGVLGHALFDFANVYGVRLFVPFTDRWFQADVVHVVDPWILLALLLAVAWPALASLVSSEIGARRKSGRGWAVLALAFVLTYGAVRVVLHSRAVEILNARTYQGEAPRRVAAWPTIFNPFRWIGYAEGATFHSLHSVNLLENFDPTVGAIYYKPERSPKVEAALNDPAVRSYLGFARYACWRITPVNEPEGATQVEIFDLRFGSPQAPRFITSVLLDAQNRVIESRFTFGPFRAETR